MGILTLNLEYIYKAIINKLKAYGYKGIFIFYILIFPLLLAGQDEERLDRLTIIDVNFNMSQPHGPFKRNVDHKLIGFEFGAHFQLNPSHAYAFGLEAFYNYIDGYSLNFFDVVDGASLELREATTSHMIGTMASLKYFPEISIGAIKPFVQALVGPKILFTQTTLSDARGEDIVSEYDVIETDVSLSYGAAVGCNVQLGSVVFLNARVSYLPGNSATYYYKLPEGDIPESDFAIDAFKKTNSATPIIRYSLGVSLFL
jgi:hypothetical protein